jgi:hypothetical protein
VWHELVEFCRTEGGGDAQFQRHGFSLKSNINVPYDHHEEFLAGAGLLPERDSSR